MLRTVKKMKVSELSVEEFESIIKRVLEEEIEDLLISFSPHIRGKIEEGLKDIKEGRTVPLDAIRARKGVKGG
jgi:hypothetical protein